MPEARETEAEIERHEAQEPAEFRVSRIRRPLGIAVGVVAVLACLVLLPPLLNVNRYRRQISSSISASLGRPVRLDAVSLNLLPIPGFTLSNFVVNESADFGAEPVIRANSVRATLRMWSLWHRRVEFSRIALAEPSVNIVHLPDGRWNLESILLQASRMPASPTSQVNAGGAQRFPYIEASGARVNLKQGGEKTPYSLTDATFALWLPEPERWQLRLEGHPARTDTAVSDTGTLRIEGSLGHAATLAAVPVQLRADWTSIPIGSMSEMVWRHDAGFRGEVHLTANLQGTLGNGGATSQVQLVGFRRADFVPSQAADVTVACSAHLTNLLLTFSDLKCVAPVASKTSGEGQVRLSGSISDVRHPQTSEWTMTASHIPAAALLDAWRVASVRVPANVTLAGEANGSLTHTAGKTRGAFTLEKAVLGRNGKPIAAADVEVRVADESVVIDPVPLDLGGSRPTLIGGHFDLSGSELEISGAGKSSRLLEVGEAVPQLGDGLNPLVPAGSPVFSLNAHARRHWGTDQVWESTSLPVVRTRSRSKVRHRSGTAS